MDLLNNPRVDAEKKIKILHDMLDFVISYKSGRFGFDYEGGIVARMYINPYIKTEKASRIIKMIHKEISKTEKILRSF